ncbi:tetratricopeptide repeat protein [Maridesulfovibrio sp.]|uniref:tetratricopeptide repeat protein n=1 Tax=Maridesulfovibrio sp. TaxID=2795000 RepID=UPI0029F504C1|nr:tetratricopeptide repeat protein [Maridesulfovibrio sp.]
MGKKNRKNGKSSKSGSNNTIIIVIAALAAGLFLGSVIIPAFKDSATPQSTGGMSAGGGFEQQIADTKRMLEAQPDSATLWAKLGNIYFDTNQPEKAIEAYSNSIALSPDDPHVLTDLGVMYRRAGKPQKAVEFFDKAILASPEHETARFNKGIVLYYDLKDKAGAIQAWKGLLQMNPAAKTPNGKHIQDMINDLS